MAEEREPTGNLSKSVELVRRARAGDGDALAQLSDRFRGRLRRWATGRIPAGLRGLLDTEDLVQGALLKTCDRIDQLRASGAFHAYLRQVVDNDLRTAIRRRRTVDLPEAAAELVDPGPTPAETLLGRELAERYEQALAGLAERERAAVIGRMEWGLSYGQLALDLDFPSADAARMAISRALVRLSQELRRDG